MYGGQSQSAVHHWVQQVSVFMKISLPSSISAFIAAENEIWAPFIKSAWENGKVTQTGWGNAIILSPTGDEVKYSTISYDIYPSLKEALNPTWAEDIEIPDMTKIGEAEGNNRRASAVYQIVQFLMAD
jgi:hypothetical protein